MNRGIKQKANAVQVQENTLARQLLNISKVHPVFGCSIRPDRKSLQANSLGLLECWTLSKLLELVPSEKVDIELKVSDETITRETYLRVYTIAH